jgi:hypothetical protein
MTARKKRDRSTSKPMSFGNAVGRTAVTPRSKVTPGIAFQQFAESSPKQIWLTLSNLSVASATKTQSPRACCSTKSGACSIRIWRTTCPPSDVGVSCSRMDMRRVTWTWSRSLRSGTWPEFTRATRPSWPKLCRWLSSVTASKTSIGFAGRSSRQWSLMLRSRESLLMIGFTRSFAGFAGWKLQKESTRFRTFFKPARSFTGNRIVPGERSWRSDGRGLISGRPNKKVGSKRAGGPEASPWSFLGSAVPRSKKSPCPAHADFVGKFATMATFERLRKARPPRLGKSPYREPPQ